jgi:uncharacterized protein YdeI (YjbR/CyaY-like superfamily)
MAPIFFPSPAAFRAWLARNHARQVELMVGFWKVGTGRPPMTWAESVDEAICFGWIDSVRRSLGRDGYVIRFTPRKAGSAWSAVNRRKAEALVTAGRMAPAGLAAWEARPDRDGAGYSFESRVAVRLPRAMARRLRANAAAWAWFSARPPGERRSTVHWLTSAKQEATRARRLEVLVETAARGVHIPPFKLLDQKRATARKPAPRRAASRLRGGGSTCRPERRWSW